ncbi:MAG: hypothetical protein ACOX60_01335 [Massiliimalia sp.]|jgi:glucan-binding YG repeat protein
MENKNDKGEENVMKNNKKLLAALLAVMMAASSSVVVFADEAEKTEEKDSIPSTELTQATVAIDPIDVGVEKQGLVGDGTQNNPYQISDASQLTVLSTDAYVSGRYVYVKLMNDIDLSKSTPSFGTAYINCFQGEFDGNGHKIYGAATGTSVFKNFLEGKIQNLTWNIENTYAYLVESNGSSKRNSPLKGCTYEGISVIGNVVFPDSTNNNESPLVVYASGMTTFKNVIISANISSVAAYNGIFVGYKASWSDTEGNVKTTFNFENCSYTGTAVGDQLGMFFGNPTGMESALKDGSLSITVKNCALTGTITGNRADFLVANVGGNQYAEGSKIKELNSKIINENDGLNSNNLQQSQEITDFTITKNKDGKIKITKNSSSQSISEIRIAVSVYSNRYDKDGNKAGTYLHTKTERISVDKLEENKALYPVLGYDSEFYDGAGTVGTIGSDQSIETVTVDGKAYLKLCTDFCEKDDCSHRFADTVGTSKKADMIRLVAYDANGKQIGIISTIGQEDFTVPTEPSIPEQNNAGITIKEDDGNQSIFIAENANVSTLEDIKLPEGCSWLNPKMRINDGGQTCYYYDTQRNVFSIYVEKEVKQDNGNNNNGGSIGVPGTGTPIGTGTWKQSPAGWWYQNPDGTYPVNQWKYLDSGKGYKAWYLFNQNGYITFGWQKVGNTWYYMNRSGEMQTGWQFINNKWYYLNSNGAMATGWVKDGNKWYFMNKDGSMHFGWLSWAGYWYHLDSHGVMSTGWKQVNGKWYYMYAENGRMAANTTTPDGYYVNANGEWIK